MSALALVLALQAGEAPERATASHPGAEVIYAGEAALTGCAIGDLDPRRRGAEVALVGADGAVHVLHARLSADDPGWEAETVAETAGALVQCATGDAYADVPGDELLVFGMAEGEEREDGPGAAFLVSRKDDTWWLELALEDTALLHGGCIADLDPASPGAELVLGGFSRRLHVLRRTGERWEDEPLAELGGAVKCILPFRGGAAVATTDGRVTHLVRRGDSWSLLPLAQLPGAPARLGTDGTSLIAACDDGALVEIARYLPQPTPVHHASAKLRGAVRTDLDASRFGRELATAGYDRTVTVIYSTGEPHTVEAYTDEAALHHLAAGELDTTHPGMELVACGLSGRAVLIRVGR